MISEFDDKTLFELYEKQKKKDKILENKKKEMLAFTRQNISFPSIGSYIKKILKVMTSSLNVINYERLVNNNIHEPGKGYILENRRKAKRKAFYICMLFNYPHIFIMIFIFLWLLM